MGDREGRRRRRLPPHAAPYKIKRTEGDREWHLLGELQVRELRLLRELGGHKSPGFSTFLANLEDCVSALNWKGREKATGMEAWGEDLLMQRCMDLHGVDKVEAFDITTDSMCRAFRPKGEKSNAKWRPNCALTSTAAMHPFMKPFDYFECLKATQR